MLNIEGIFNCLFHNPIFETQVGFTFERESESGILSAKIHGESQTVENIRIPRILKYLFPVKVIDSLNHDSKRSLPLQKHKDSCVIKPGRKFSLIIKELGFVNFLNIFTMNRIFEDI